MPAPNDRPWCRSRGGADLSRNRRCSCPFPKLQGGRCGVWIDTLQVSIGRERPNRRDITVRRRDDAGNALRSGRDPIGALGEMVLAQGLGDEDCQAPRAEKGDRGLARRLAVIMHRIWVDGTEFRWTREVAAT